MGMDFAKLQERLSALVADFNNYNLDMAFNGGKFTDALSLHMGLKYFAHLTDIFSQLEADKKLDEDFERLTGEFRYPHAMDHLDLFFMSDIHSRLNSVSMNTLNKNGRAAFLEGDMQLVTIQAEFMAATQAVMRENKEFGSEVEQRLNAIIDEMRERREKPDMMVSPYKDYCAGAVPKITYDMPDIEFKTMQLEVYHNMTDVCLNIAARHLKQFEISLGCLGYQRERDLDLPAGKAEAIEKGLMPTLEDAQFMLFRARGLIEAVRQHENVQKTIAATIPDGPKLQ